MSTIGQRIQELRKKAGLTQVGLAKKINVSHTQMTRYEIKDVQPPADVLKRFADLFGTSIDYIVRGNKSDFAAESLEDAELIKHFQQIDDLPKEEQGTVLKFLGAYLRDYRARQAYAA